MPQLGETVTEGTITRWMKQVGDQVARDEPLFEVSTDKVDSEVPSPAAGVLTEILAQEGDTVEVGARLAVIGEAAEAAPAAPAAAAAPAEPAPAPAVAPAPAAAPAPPPVAPAPPPPVAPPAAPAPAPAPAVPPPAPVPAPVPAAEAALAAQAPATAPESVPAGGDQRVLSPVVRRLLADNGIDASEVTGTGVGGRITREDVLAVVDTRSAGTTPARAPAPAPEPTPAPAPPTPPAPTVAAAPPEPAAPPPPAASAPAPAVQPPAAQPPADAAPAVIRSADRVIPFSNMRRRTAEHMVRSKATSPHAFIAYEVDFENVERVRRSEGERFKAEEGFSLTYLPFVARAAVEALREYPNLNASVAEDALVVHQQVNLGIAVDLDHEGLIVPVVHRADEITLRGIARRVRDLADRARSRQLGADDIAGGTFSITNDGPFGTYFTVPIINQPQVAILATDGVTRRPVVVTLPDGSESIAVHSVGVLGMSWDHRAVDGAYVSSFLRLVADLLGSRDWAAEL
jgi:2-oxoglutarate dehydrogenase E2 component (dihydrolipoamide succinyltransferase)